MLSVVAFGDVKQTHTRCSPATLDGGGGGGATAAALAATGTSAADDVASGTAATGADEGAVTFSKPAIELSFDSRMLIVISSRCNFRETFCASEQWQRVSQVSERNRGKARTCAKC